MPIQFKKGDIAVLAAELDKPNLYRFTVVKVEGDYLHGNREGEIFHRAFCFPEKAEAELTEILKKRQALKKAYDDSMGLVYELVNKCIRGEVRE